MADNYDELIDQYTADAAQGLRQNVFAVADKNPDQEAALQSTAKQYQVPVDTVRFNQADYERLKTVDSLDYDSLVSQLPATGAVLGDPEKAAISHDDVHNLGTLEKFLQFPTNARRSISSGIFAGTEGIAGVLQAGAEQVQQLLEPTAGTLLPVNIAEPVVAMFKNIRESQTAWRKHLEAGAGDMVTAPDSPLRNLESGYYSGLQSLSQNALALPAALAIDRPDLALSGMAAMTGGQSYGKARDEGLSPNRAVLYGAGDAAIEYATEKFGVDNLFKSLKAGSPMLKTMGDFLAREMPGEQAATALQDMNEWLNIHPEKSFQDYLDARPDAAIQTAVATLVGGGGQVAIMKGLDSALNGADQARNGMDDQHYIAALSALAAANKVRGRSISTFQDFVKDASNGSNAENVYIDAKVLHQSGLADDLKRVSPAVADQYGEALASGGDVRIPMDEYLTHVAGTEMDRGLLEHLRLKPEEMSHYEADAFMSSFESGDVVRSEMEKALQWHDRQTVERTAVQNVRANILADLQAIGVHRPKVNEAYADLMSAFFGTMSRRLGVDAEALHAKYPLRVRAEGLGKAGYYQTELENKSSMPRQAVSFNEARAAAKDFQGTTLTGGHGFEASVSRNNLDKMLSAKAVNKSSSASDHALAVANLDKLFAEAVHGWSKADDNKHHSLNAVHRFFAPMMTKDGMRLVKMTVKESSQIDQGRKIYTVESLKVEKEGSATMLVESLAKHDGLERISIGNAEPIDNLAQDIQDYNTVFHQSTLYQKRKGDIYTHDLFGNDLSQGRGDAGATPAAHESLYRDDTPPGTYATKTKMSEEGSRELGAAAVNSPAEAAQALAYLARGAVERLDALVTDKDGKPLAVVGAFKGAIASASVYPATIVSEAFRIKGAANIWFAHNHPSGTAELSRADRDIYKKLYNIFDGSAIAPRGMLAIGGAEGAGRKWVYTDYVSNDEYGTTGTVNKTVKTPVIERVFADESKLSDASVNDFKNAVAAADQVSGGQSGIMLMDTQHYPVAFVPMHGNDSSVLRGNGGMDALFRALSMSNASNAIVVNQGDMRPIEQHNLANFLRGADVSVLDVLEKQGRKFISHAESGLLTKGTHFNQEGDNRGAFTPHDHTITFLKKADASTFLHESGHFYLETLADLAAQADAPVEIVGDFERILEWFGINGGVDAWHALPFEQKIPYHEQFARGFESYLFEGKAPSLELAGIFNKFAAWLKKVYEHFSALNVELSDEVRRVFDRLLASDEQIAIAQRSQSMMPIFKDAVEAGMTPDEFAAYQAREFGATESADMLLGRRAVQDLQWVQNARSGILKRMQAENEAKRKAIRREVRMEVLGEPVYRAWAFLTNKLTPGDKIIPPRPRKSNPDVLDPELDSLFTAIAKLGGLNREELESTWGFDPAQAPASGVFGKPVVRKVGGLTIDHMLEGLVQHGYIVPGEKGALPNQLEDLFDKELRWDKQYSNQAAFNDIFTDEARPGEHVVNPAGLGAGRLDLNALKNMQLPEAIVANLEDAGMTAKDGLHPDLVAELPGIDFGSGDELVRTLAAAPTPREEIERRTDERMLETYGDITSPAALEQAANLAIHNEVRARFLKSEADALAKASGKKRIQERAAREFARQIIARQRVRDLQPGQYTAAERRAGQAVVKALRKGDMATAAAEQRNQIYNFYAGKECLDALDEIEKMIRYFAKFDSRSIRSLVAADYTDQIVELLERVELRPVSQRTRGRRASLQKFVEEQKAIGKEPDIPDFWLDAANRINYKDLRVDELRGLKDTIEQIEHLGRMKNKLLKSQKARNVQEAQAEIVASVEKYAGDRVSNTRTATDKAGRLRELTRSFLAAHFKMPTAARILDGDTDAGAMWEYIVRPLNIASDWKTGMIADLSKKVDALMSPVYALGRMQEVMYFPELPKIQQDDERVSGLFKGWGKSKPIGRGLNRIERMAVAFNSGNQSNMQRLMAGEKWNYQQVQKIRESLTLAEWQAVQGVWDLFESLRPEIAAKERRVYGVEPAWIDPLPFEVTTADGHVFKASGGYYPVKFDPRASQKAAEHGAAQTLKEQLQAAYTSATTRRSFTKARVDEVFNRPLVLNWAGLFDGLNEVVNDLAFHEIMIDMNQLMKEKGGVDEVIRAHYGPEAVGIFKHAQKDIAGGEKYMSDVVGRAFGVMRQYVGLSVLGLRLMSGVQQITGFVQTAERIGKGWMVEGIKQYVSNPEWSRERVHELSSFMANRQRTQFRDLNDARNRLNDDPAFQRWLNDNGYFLIIRMQEMVDLPTWVGAYSKACAEGREERLAIDLADQAVKDSQGSGLMMDQAEVERIPWAKLFTMFYSFQNTVLNLGLNSGMSAKSAGSKAATFLNLYVMTAFYSVLLLALFVPGDDDKWEELPRSVASATLSNMLSGIVGVREFDSVFQEGLLGHGFDYHGPTSLKIVEDAYKLTVQGRQGEFDDGFRKAMVSFLGDVGKLPGAAQVNDTISGVQALAQGKTHNPLAIAFGYKEARH
ncbi:JAB domain-containing protein [Methylomonas sp. AM2-LC]|uniref:LPD3 domain-containing protein n=1 Tax=Methylomonas sp. AM2-LC TaxID=3153301 RepID=UPI00326448DF